MYSIDLNEIIASLFYSILEGGIASTAVHIVPNGWAIEHVYVRYGQVVVTWGDAVAKTVNTERYM